MSNQGEQRRIGFVRIYGLTWKMNSELIKKKIGPENIIEIRQPREDGRDLDAQDIVFIHPDFDEIGEGDAIPLYSFDISTGEFSRSA